MSETAARSVVVADDDAVVRELLAEYLGRHSWQVFEAVNGLDALLHVKRQRPTSVLLDLRMPRLGGIETLKRIRAFDPTISVVILSGNLDAEVRRQAETIGAAGILHKPVDLPAVLAALNGSPLDGAPVAAAAPAPTAARPPAVRTVLVVDDDADVRAMLEEFLAAKGYCARGAGDGAAAIRELAASPVDVVLIDVDMPDLGATNATDALPILRAVASAAAIIMVSGTNDQTARRALAAGAFDYVIKPVNFVHLIDTIETALAMHAVAL